MNRTIVALEDRISAICNDSFPLEWDEDHISFLLMKELRNIFGHRRINFTDWSKIVAWRSFKNRGTPEHKYGDIALIVNIQFSSGEYLRGVACIEAKRSFPSGSFESMDLTQLERLKNNLPYSHLLLYNSQNQNLHLKFPDQRSWSSHFWISPINTAIQLLDQTSVRDNWKVLRTSFPFTMFLTSRIFWGLDLDYRDSIRKDLINGINNILNPSYLGVVDIYYDGQQPIEVQLSDLWEEIR